MKIKLLPKPTHMFAKNLDDAYNKKLFSGSLIRSKLIEFILKKHPDLKVIENETHAGLFNSVSGRFICGIPKISRLPQFSISKFDKRLHPMLPLRDENSEIVGYQEMNFEKDMAKVFCKSYKSIFKDLRREGYEIDVEKAINYSL